MFLDAFYALFMLLNLCPSFSSSLQLVLVTVPPWWWEGLHLTKSRILFFVTTTQNLLLKPIQLRKNYQVEKHATR